MATSYKRLEVLSHLTDVETECLVPSPDGGGPQTPGRLLEDTDGYDVISPEVSQFQSLKSKDISKIFIFSNLVFLLQVLCAVLIINKDDYSDFYRRMCVPTSFII